MPTCTLSEVRRYPAELHLSAELALRTRRYPAEYAAKLTIASAILPYSLLRAPCGADAVKR